MTTAGDTVPSNGGQVVATTADDAALLPRSVRRVVIGIFGLLVAFACYLFIVRGPALLLDLAHSAASMFCL